MVVCRRGFLNHLSDMLLDLSDLLQVKAEQPQARRLCQAEPFVTCARRSTFTSWGKPSCCWLANSASTRPPSVRAAACSFLLLFFRAAVLGLLAPGRSYNESKLSGSCAVWCRSVSADPSLRSHAGIWDEDSRRLHDGPSSGSEDEEGLDAHGPPSLWTLWRW